MNSPWKTEVLAVFRKEAMTELRTKSGLATGALFGFATVVTVAFALFNINPNRVDAVFHDAPLKDVCASLLWTIVLFSALLSLPRAFLAEEENGTADLLRLMARPHAVFWGKMLFNILQTWALSLFLSILFIAFTGLEVPFPAVFMFCLLGGGASVAGAVTLCGALAAQASNRAALAGAIAVPLLLPLLQWGVTGMKSSFGGGFEGAGVSAAVGMVSYSVLVVVVGPWIYAAVWKS